MRPIRGVIDASLVGRAMTGDSTYWTGLVHGMAQVASEDFELVFVSDRARPRDLPLPPNGRWLTVPSRSRRWWNYARLPLAARRLRAAFLHTQYSVSPLAPPGAVTTIHDVSFFVEPAWFRPRDRFLLRRFVPSSVRRAARVITVSETSRRDIERFLPEARGKVRVTPNARGVGIRPLSREEARAIVGEELGIEGPYVFTVGTRWARKNLELALEASRRWESSLPHRLIWSGKGPSVDPARYPRARGTGYVDDRLLSALYSAADLFVFPSRYEGFGVPVLEAWACGCPVLCSAGGALPEVAGEAAEVLDSWDPPEWARAVEALLGDSGKLDDMRVRGRERERLFTWSRTALLTLEVYREVTR